MESPCDQLTERRRDICRGHDDAGRPVLTPEKRAKYIAKWVREGTLPDGDWIYIASANQEMLPAAESACIHLGDQLRVEVCKTCGRKGAPAAVFACAKHGECTLRKFNLKDQKLPACVSCPDFAASKREPIIWAVGITTAPREQPTLEKTVNSVITAGWQPVVYAEPETPIECVSAPVVTRGEKLGPWKNWLRTAGNLLDASTSHVLILQDDVLLSADARKIVEETPWPRDVGCRSLYTEAGRNRRKDGRHELRSRDFRGALGLAFPAHVLSRILKTQAVTTWDKPANIDTVIGRAMSELGLKIDGFSPSLGQHIGETSTIYRDEEISDRRAVRRKAKRWRGETGKLPSVAVVVLSHNYGRFLAEALNSVLAQTVKPAEILVVDDASDDDTASVAAGYESRGVKYLRVDVRNTHAARAAGFRATMAEVLCFLDADDVLDREYLAAGLPIFADAGVGVVFSDLHQFGAMNEINAFPKADSHLDRENYAHAGSLVRRSALVMAEPFERAIPSASSNDWFLWKHIARFGWRLEKSSGIYRYRRHTVSQSFTRKGIGYFDLANLNQEDVTIFVPLSGRWKAWKQLSGWLADQSWPHRQTRLVLCDTSRHAGFASMLRTWLSGTDYGDVRLYQQSVGPDGLADSDRTIAEIRQAVKEAMPRIYNRAIREATTEWIVVVEDDVLPPVDAVERMMRGMSRDVASVSGAYKSRYHDGFVAWDRAGEHLPLGEGVQQIGGNGFGCVLLRRSIAAEHVFHCGAPRFDYDPNFYRWLASERPGFRALVDWSVQCEHG